MCAYIGENDMNRTQIYLTDNEHSYLKKEANKIGISKAELIRRILDNYIKKERKNEETTSS